MPKQYCLINREGDNDMPKVGKKSYPYTKKGVARAKAAAKRKGGKVGRKKK